MEKWKDESKEERRMWVGNKEEGEKFIRQQEPDQVVKEGGTGGGLRKGKEEEEIGASMYRYKYSTAFRGQNISGV